LALLPADPRLRRVLVVQQLPHRLPKRFRSHQPAVLLLRVALLLLRQRLSLVSRWQARPLQRPRPQREEQQPAEPPLRRQSLASGWNRLQQQHRRPQRQLLPLLPPAPAALVARSQGARQQLLRRPHLQQRAVSKSAVSRQPVFPSWSQPLPVAAVLLQLLLRLRALLPLLQLVAPRPPCPSCLFLLAAAALLPKQVCVELVVFFALDRF
jgi:hypothetical protein